MAQKQFVILDVIKTSLRQYWQHIFFFIRFFIVYVGALTAGLFVFNWILFGYESSVGQKIVEFYRALWTSATTGSLLFPYSEFGEFITTTISDYEWQFAVLFFCLFFIHSYFSLKITQTSLEIQDEGCCSGIIWFISLTTLLRGLLGLFVYDVIFNLFDVGVGSLPELVQIILGSPLLLIKVSLLTTFSFYEHIIIDQSVTVFKAFAISARIMRGVGVKMWIFLALMESFNAFVFIFIPLFLIVTWPCSYIALAYLYRKFEKKSVTRVV